MYNTFTEYLLAQICSLEISEKMYILSELLSDLEVFSVDQFCDVTGEKRRDVYRKIKSGELGCVEVGGKRFPSIKRYLESV